MELPFKIEIEKTTQSGKPLRGTDYFATKAAAERGAADYRKRGFTVGPIINCKGEATTVSVL